MSMFYVIFMKLMIVKTKELMRRHDAKLFKEDDDQCNEKGNLKPKFLRSDLKTDWTQDWNEQLWTRRVMSRAFKTERDKVQAMDCESWRFLKQESVRNEVINKRANVFMTPTYLGRTMIRKFTRMRVDIGIG